MLIMVVVVFFTEIANAKADSLRADGLFELQMKQTEKDGTASIAQLQATPLESDSYVGISTSGSMGSTPT